MIDIIEEIKTDLDRELGYPPEELFYEEE